MLSPSKKVKLLLSLKSYNKKYLSSKLTELDESGTRLMINEFLTSVLGYLPIDEVRTEYMIKGTYADYVIQIKGVRHFLVEVKALSFDLSEKHLRQAVNYGANEGIDWALLTNGKIFEFYRILFTKPIESRRIFTIDLSDPSQYKSVVEVLQFLHKDSVTGKGLDLLWNKNCALDPNYVSGLLYSPKVTSFIKSTLKAKFKTKFTDEEVSSSISQVICLAIKPENVKHIRAEKKARPVKEKAIKAVIIEQPGPSNSESSSDSLK